MSNLDYQHFSSMILTTLFTVRFQQYCRQPGGRPVISRGEAAQEVRLGFGLKEEAVRALADNRSNPQFPGLGVAPCSRG